MKKMFAVFTLVMALLLINFTTDVNAIQVKMPTGPCQPSYIPGPNVPPCVGGYTLQDMGHFDGDTWVWNNDFLDTAEAMELASHPAFGSSWEDIIKPIKFTLPPNITSGRFDRRYFAPGREPEVRIAFQASSGGEAVSYVPLYLGECFKQVIGSNGINQRISTPCASDPEVTQIFMTTEYDSPPNAPYILHHKIQTTSAVSNLTMNDIESVKWVEKNLDGVPLNPILTHGSAKFSMSYNTSTRFWNPMPSTPDWSPVTELQVRWRPIPDLALGETATFEIKVRDIPDPIYAVSAVKSLNTMPSILATITGTDYNILKEKEKKSGKMVIKAEEVLVTTNNITVREVADPSGGNALVIQWPEPDIALFGGADMLSPNERYQVSVTVGATGPGTYSPDGWYIHSIPNQTIYEYFLGYNVPAQMGTCVVEAPVYDALLLKMAEIGYAKSDLRVSIQYREVYANNDQSKPLPIPVVPGQTPLQFQNRGMSPWVPINTF